MTPSQLKQAVEQAGHSPHFFSRESMRFFGDTMRNYGVRSAVVHSGYDASTECWLPEPIAVDCWEVYRKQPVKHGLKSSAFFCKKTFRRIYTSGE